MSVSIYFTGRNQKPSAFSLDQSPPGIMDILVRECPNISTSNCRYYVDNQQKILSDLTLSEVRGRTLVVLGEELKGLTHEEIVRPITLYLRQPDGKTLKTHMRPIEPVLRVKHLLAERFGVGADQWQILYKGQELNNDYQLLLEHRISNNNIIHTVQRALQDGSEVEIVFPGQKIRNKMHLDMSRTIHALKQELHKVTGLEGANQMLIYCGGELADDRTLASYHISQGGQIFLVDKREKGAESRAEWFREARRSIDAYSMGSKVEPRPHPGAEV